jgi:hypothetical protein
LEGVIKLHNSRSPPLIPRGEKNSPPYYKGELEGVINSITPAHRLLYKEGDLRLHFLKKHGTILLYFDKNIKNSFIGNIFLKKDFWEKARSPSDQKKEKCLHQKRKV